jgi:hypothetical protein
MSKKEAAMVFGVTVVGLLPAYGVYQYVLEHPVIPVSIEVTHTAAVGAVEQRLYQSQPVKETDGVCKNSFYATFLLAISAQGNFSLTKRCESVRDTNVVWRGTMNEQVNASSTAPMQVFVVTHRADKLLAEPTQFILEEKGNEYVILQSSFTEMASTTRFESIGKK